MSTTKSNASLNNQKQTMLVLAGLLMAISGQAASAQSMYADDSLLPPEVVPMDPAVAQALSQKQAASRAAGMAEAQMAPGMVTPGGMQTPQEASRSMYNSLMGSNGQLPPQFANYPPQGLQPAGNGQGPGSTQLGQSAWMQPGQEPGAAPAHVQSQTMTGSVKYKPTLHDTRRGGFSNAFSAIAGFGSGIAMGGLVRRPSTALGLGMFGMGLTGVGSRNGIRF